MIRKHRKVDASKHLMEIGKKVQEGWNKSANKHQLLIKVGGIPPLSNFTFAEKNPEVMKAIFVEMMLEKGFLASSSFYSMYTHKEKHVNQYLKVVDEIFSRLAESKQKGTLNSILKGQPSATGFKRLT